MRLNTKHFDVILQQVALHRRSYRPVSLLLLFAYIGICGLSFSGCKEGDYFFFYVVEEEEKKVEGEQRIEYFKDEKFDADKIVEDIWDTKVIPAVKEQAVDLRTLIDALDTDPEAAGQQYGHREEGGNYPWNFMVKSRAKIVEVNTRSRKGRLSVDIPPYDGEADATIWIGPIITSYSVRDALDFVSFTTGVAGSSGTQYIFDTQVQFAELSNSLNRRGNQEVLKHLEPKICITLTADSFQSLEKKDVPADVVNALKDLQDQDCMVQEQFWEEVQERIGADPTEHYKDLLFKYADTNGTGQGKEIHFYGAMTYESSGDMTVTPLLLEFVEEGSS